MSHFSATLPQRTSSICKHINNSHIQTHCTYDLHLQLKYQHVGNKANVNVAANISNEKKFCWISKLTERNCI